MPLYEYECEACGRRFEVIQRFSDRLAEQCTLCGAGPVRKLFSSPAIQFKGSGWYITDYAKKDQKSGAAKDDQGAAKGDQGAAKGDQKETAGSGDTSTAKDKPAKEKGSASDKAASGSTSEKRPASASSSSGKE